MAVDGFVGGSHFLSKLFKEWVRRLGHWTRRFSLTVLLALPLAWLAWAASAAPGDTPAAERKVHADLVAAVSAVQPGTTVAVGLRQRIAPHWHTYWKNPGDSGEPTRLTWDLPAGVSASDIDWPMPEAIPVGPLMNYGYSDLLLLPVRLTVPALFEGSEILLTAKAEWLVCEKICIPEQQTVSLRLPVVRDGAPPQSAEAALFEAAERARPVALPWPARVKAAGGDVLTLSVNAPMLERARISAIRFFPDKWGQLDHAAKQDLTWTESGFRLRLKRGELPIGADGPALSGLLAVTEKLDGRDVRTGFEFVAAANAGEVGGDAASPASPSALAGGAGGSTGAGGGEVVGLWQAMVLALLGGMILNLMPCVLPILSLKVMSLAAHAGSASRGGVAYLAGVALTFAFLAAVLVGLRAAGEGLGWGFQFQSPAFVLGMVALFFALGLSMSGVFDIGGSVVGVGEGLTRRSGLGASFATGVLATVAATPCTAPFMGAAVGYALTRPAYETFLVLQALGFGFGLPVLVLAVSGAAQRVLPRPGPWMVTLKQVLAFPLYATVAWLVWVLSIQAGSSGVLAAGVVLLGVGFAAWFLGQNFGAMGPRAVLAVGVGVIAIVGALAVIEPVGTANQPTAGRGVPVGDAEPYSPSRVTALRAEGRPVFVNFTAAWCISCKVNERVALSTEGFRAGLRRHNIAYLKGDWTNKNDEIARVLRSYGRAGVPLYLLFPAAPDAPPVVLPQLLTEGIVVRHFAALQGTNPGPNN